MLFRTWITLAGLNGALSVALGAYAAHGFDPSAEAYAVSLMEKATRHQMVAALALLAVAWLAERSPTSRRPVIAGGLLSLGILLFCGALYGIALFGAPLASLAPFGGVSLILAFFAIAWAGWEKQFSHPD